MYRNDADVVSIRAQKSSVFPAADDVIIDIYPSLVLRDAYDSDLGSNPVTIEAVNSQGTDTQVFAIDVSGVAPASYTPLTLPSNIELQNH